MSSYFFVLCFGLSAAVSELRNVALNKPAFQTTNESPDTPARLAVDGNSNPDYRAFSCASTFTNDQTRYAWWMVDLETPYRISTITIQNRGDCCGDRLKNLSIKIGKTESNLTERAVFPGPGTSGSFHELEIDNVIGRYVKIDITGPLLTLCEVKVWASDIKRDAKFTVLPGTKSNAVVLNNLEAGSVLTCVAQCVSLSSCTAVNYREAPSDGITCQLLTAADPQEIAQDYQLIILFT